MYPRLIVDLNKLRENGERICAMAARAGIDRVAFVTKCFCAAPEMIRALETVPNVYLADSRLENLKRYPKTAKKKILLRLPMLSRAEEVVREADVSFCSELAALHALEQAAAHQDKMHRVVLMVDVGDLREGVFFRDEKSLLELAEETEFHLPHLELLGMAFNVTCYGSVIPTAQTFDLFRSLVRKVEKDIGRPLRFVSGGNSSSVYLLEREPQVFEGINNLRLGESLLLGGESSFGGRIPGMNYDVFTLETELIEVKRKPSYPIGKLGMNAFGQVVEYVDKGEMLRGIAAAGQQDVECTGLTPLTPGMEVVGASSDHLLLDLTRCGGKVGEIVRFRPNYTALLRAFTSEYVEKVYR